MFAKNKGEECKKEWSPLLFTLCGKLVDTTNTVPLRNKTKTIRILFGSIKSRLFIFVPMY
jgi:hypothetical protein